MTQQKESLNSYYTESGKTVNKITTFEFAEFLLNNPEKVYGFTTTLHDIHENPLKTISPWPYFYAANVRFIDSQIIYIKRSCDGGGNPFVFDLLDYDKDISVDYGEKQSINCFNEIINGLTKFNQEYGEFLNTWYITNKVAKVNIMYFE